MMLSEVVLECRDCAETMRLVAETQQAMRCRCGASWLPERDRHHETSTKAKRTQSPEETVAKDLALLARWHSRFYGRGMSLEPSIGGDREAQEDERSQEFHRAAQIHRKLEAMRTGDGCLHYQVLWFAHVEREAVKDLHWEIGWRFATPKRRAKWAQNKLVAIAHAAIRRYGAKVHSAACAAYQASNGDLS